MSTERELIEQIEQQARELSEAVAAAEYWYEKAIAAIQEEHASKLNAIQAEHERVMQAVAQEYEQNLTQIRTELAGFEAEFGFAEKDWESPDWNRFTPANEQHIPRVTRVGRLTTRGTYGNLEMPALAPIIGGRNLLIRSAGPGKVMARETMQAISLRLLATLPPGKLRLVCIDPVGLGSTMAGFIKGLPDLLTGGYAWYDERDIELRLSDLERHIANVKQKYLGRDYQTMEEYNVKAGEVAEPYRLLIVADFPVRFTPSAAQRLISIATNGPGAGVYVLAMVDTQKEMPHNFNLQDLERTGTILSSDDSGIVWQDPDFRDCVLTLDHTPPAELFDRIMSTVGAKALETSEVQVPFEKMVPQADLWWRSDSRHGIQAAIGQMGAREQVELALDEKLLNSVLVVGRPGSGKSTLLHTLIVSLAMNYSPKELHFYLIDFKQVEFKDYAAFSLPHARIVAINSEREFGLSVLQGLQQELQRRSDLLRDLGHQSLSEYRDKTNEKLPRILLIADEFQELFIRDDEVAREAAQILDRLVRLGRAFGINILLASQTLAGQYTLSRSTRDQIQVRIALQSADIDSRLVLSDENDHARLLERPGEAIYNALNGRVEGNKLFQVYWLSDDRRESYLDQLREISGSIDRSQHQPLIVFDGNAPSSIEANRDLLRLLDAPEWPGVPDAVRAWIGEPIAIKEHTAAEFRRQAGSNLLVVGQNQYEKQAVAMLTAALISLFSQYRPGEADFVILDLTAVNSEWHDNFTDLTVSFPNPITVHLRQETATAIDKVYEEYERRSVADHDENLWPACYLVISGLHRARDLKLPEDYFPKPDEPLSLAKKLGTICREGPSLGIHSLLWCDTYTGLERVFDRTPERLFDLRVTLQMGVNDSRRLIDVDHANQLGPYRAFYFDEQQTGLLEKFRPYDLPTHDWIEWAGKKLTARQEM